MKILAVADIEEAVLYEKTKREKIGRIDLLISCGDLKEDYLSYLATTYEAPLFFVRGNHDRAITPAVNLGENLHTCLVTYQRLKFLGFEGAPCHSGVNYSVTEMNWLGTTAWIKSVFLGKPDFIISHSPPRGIHDGMDYCHQGYPAFNKLIKRLEPKFFLHGHNHLTYDRHTPRITKVGKTTIINVYGYYLLEV